MFRAWQHRDFRLLWTADAISQLGSWLLVVAVPAQVLRLTGSVAATGLTLAAEFLPSALFGPLAGVLADRCDRRALMLAADLGRVLVVPLLLIATGPHTVWLVYLALALESTGTVLFAPAARALTPAVVGTGPGLTSANALNAGTAGVVRLVGPPLGAILLTVIGYRGLVLADAAGYLASAVLLAAVTRPPRPAPGPGRAGVRDGLRVLRSSPDATAVLTVSALFLMANAALSAILVPFGVRSLGGATALGPVLSALGAGFLLGAPLGRFLLDRLPPRVLLAAALIGTAAGFTALFHSTAILPAAAAAVLVGGCGSVALLVPRTVLQRAIPDVALGRAIAVAAVVEAVATLAGSVAGPFLAALLGSAGTALIAAGVTVAAATTCWSRRAGQPERVTPAARASTGSGRTGSAP